MLPTTNWLLVVEGEGITTPWGFHCFDDEAPVATGVSVVGRRGIWQCCASPRFFFFVVLLLWYACVGEVLSRVEGMAWGGGCTVHPHVQFTGPFVGAGLVSATKGF